ncbi:MAG: GNAT family N-acetyltransferase [Mesorhizobium sp.]|nr:GNAT family N-acetyltransferase [Mesorhizobium sp.]MBN9245633.1 GNAT family N-acetyltransferase [Mesorhizobium sp.]
MLEIIRDLPRLEAVAGPWRELAACNPAPMAGHEWAVAAAKTFGATTELAVFALWDGPRLRAVAPLGLSRVGPARRLQFLDRPLQEPDSLLFRDRAALEELVDAVAGHHRALALYGLPLDGEEEAALRGKRGGGLTLCGRPYVSHAALLPPTVAELDEQLSGNARTMLRRKLKAAQKLGAVAFSVETLDETNREAFMADLIRVEGSGWKRANGTALADLPDQRKFYEHYLELKAPGGTLRGYRMLIAGQVVAIRLGAVAGGRLYELKIGYDDAFRDCSPGMLLTHECLKAEIAEGIGVHEFLGGAEEWQKRWPLRINRHVTVRRYPLNLNGAAALAHDVFEQAGGRLRRMVRRG